MGITGVEFCDYEPENCPFGDEYCTCKDMDDGIYDENEEEKLKNDISNMDDNDLPF